MTGWAFVHNPKTGGHSIRQALELGDDWPMHQPRAALPEEVWTFGFVRNPWARQLSFYAFLRAGNYLDLDCQDDNDTSFKRWLMRDTRRLWGEPKGITGVQRRPQAWWLDGCDFVGRFERLQEDFDQACDQMGLARRSLPHLNRSQHEDYHAAYDDEMRAAVAEWFADDIASWGYTFS